MLVKGDKIVQTKEIPGVFDYVGTEFEVDGFADMKVQFHGSMGQGIMTLTEFEEYFEKVVAPPPKPSRVWSEWDYADMVSDNFVVRNHCLTQYKYRTNGKKVQAMTTNFCFQFPKIVVQSSCHPDDDFDLELGLKLCALRMKIAMLLANK